MQEVTLVCAFNGVETMKHYLTILMPVCVAGIVTLGIVALKSQGVVQIKSDWLDIVIDGTAQAEQVLPGTEQ